MKTAITGGIGSGKSYVCRLLRQRGVEVYDCDAAAKRLMRTSVALRRQLTELIGHSAYLSDGALNKTAVASFLLASRENAGRLNAIVHPAVADDFIASGMQWMECAILYESGFDRLVDRVVVVTAPYELRLSRIVSRDCISAAKAREWIDCQLPQTELQRRADIEIVNDGVCNLSEQIDKIVKNSK